MLDLILSQDIQQLMGRRGRVSVYSSASGSTMERFIIENGFAPAFGGGINNDGSLTINNSEIRNNSASLNGGGIFNMGNLVLNNVLIHDNVSGVGFGIGSGLGGGVFNAGTSLTT